MSQTDFQLDYELNWKYMVMCKRIHKQLCTQQDVDIIFFG